METWKLMVILIISIIPWALAAYWRFQLYVVTKYTNKMLDELDDYWDGVGSPPSGRTKP